MQKNAKSKNNVSGKRVEVIPSTMETGSPGELLCTDFSQYGRSNLLIIKDCFSGLLRVYITKDKTTEAATAGVAKWPQSYGLRWKLGQIKGSAMVISLQNVAKPWASVTVTQLPTTVRVMERLRKGLGR